MTDAQTDFLTFRQKIFPSLAISTKYNLYAVVFSRLKKALKYTIYFNSNFLIGDNFFLEG